MHGTTSLKCVVRIYIFIVTDDRRPSNNTRLWRQTPEIYLLNQMSKDYNFKISTGKTKIMAFKGKHLVRSKIEIDGSLLEQVK